MDNAPIHASHDIATYVEYRGYRYAYLPPYSPELNPIDQFGPPKPIIRFGPPNSHPLGGAK